MTIDRSAPLLPLDEWRRILGIHPFHFWQLQNTALAPVTSACNTLVFEASWQYADAVGRSDIVRAIQHAEDKLTDYLNFAPAPRQEYDELAFPQFYDARNTYLSSSDAQGRWLSFNLKKRKVQTLGTLTVAAIGDAAVTLSDIDGDGLDDTFTLSIATTVTDPDQIAVYFDTTDRFDGSGISERWRIQPVTVSISGGTATIKGRAWTIVKPVQYSGVGRAALEATGAVYATTLTVARHAIDTTQQGEWIWEATPDGGCDTNDPSSYLSQTARYIVRNSDAGIVAGEAAEYDTDALLWGATAWPVAYAPERARVYYTAGYTDGGPVMSEWMKIIVARLAAAELAAPICGCKVANRELSRWQFDLATSGASADAEGYQMSFEDMNCPFGTRRGQVYAWKEIQRIVEHRAVVV
jgi:hypothetical protein